jgi:hypothetical protein
MAHVFGQPHHTEGRGSPRPGSPAGRGAAGFFRRSSSFLFIQSVLLFFFVCSLFSLQLATCNKVKKGTKKEFSDREKEEEEHG